MSSIREISCTEHGKPVRLVPGEAVICHADGRYCGSDGFTAGTLDRGQAMVLMITERGMQIMRGGELHK